MDQILQNFEKLDKTNIPPWAILLMEGMQLMFTSLKALNELAVKVEALESYKAVNNTVTENLLNENKKLRDKIEVLESKVDDQEQRSRNYCLVLHGVEEKEGENTDELVINTMVNDLGIAGFSLNNIQRSHRMGPRINARNTRNNRVKPRPVIFRLSDFRIRKEIFKNKRKLKGKGVSITENLTHRRLNLLKLAQTKYGFDKVWTMEGRVTYKDGNNFVIIDSENDLI